MQNAPVNCTLVSFDAPVELDETQYVIWLVLSGGVSMTAGGEPFHLKAQDVAMFSPGDQVRVAPEKGNTLLRAELASETLIEAFGTADFSLRCNSALFPASYAPLLRELARMAEDALRADKGDSMQLLSSLYGLIGILKNSFCDLWSADAAKGASRSDERARVDSIRKFIHIHYREPLTLDMVAEHVHLTPQYLSKFFKKQFGLGFFKYLTQLRLSHACQELNRPGASVTKTALDCGFSNLSSFNKAFLEKYGMSPKDYRRTPHAHESAAPYTVLPPQDPGRFFHAFLPKEPETPLGQADTVSVSFTVDCSSFSVYTQSWQQIINLGNAANCLLSEFQEQVQNVVRRLNFRYARITNVFSDELVWLSDSGELIGLPAFARIINFMYSVDLIPFLDLGAKPAPLDLEPDSNALPKKRSYTYDDARWARLLDSFLSYCNNTWGLDYMALWRFELWQPRHFDTDLMSTDPNWSELYTRRLEMTQRIIHATVPEAQVGGPGLNASPSNLNNFARLFESMRQKGLRPDFVSVYLYPSYIIHVDEGADDRSRQNIACIVHPCDTDSAEKLDGIRQLIRRYFKEQLPLYVTEFNCDSTSRCFINDTSYRSAYIAKTVIDNLGSVDALGCWNLSDISNEELRSPELFFGGSGIITRNGLKKSSCYAYWLLNKLGGRLIAKGDNYVVCSKYANRYEVLVHNFKSLSEEYCMRHFKLPRTPKRYAVKAFEDDRAMEYSVRLTGLKPGEYLQKQYLLDRVNGDIQYGAERLLMQYNLNLVRQEELDYLSGVCVPQQMLTLVSAENGELELRGSLMPNAVLLVTVTLYST